MEPSLSRASGMATLLARITAVPRATSARTPAGGISKSQKSPLGGMCGA